MFALQIVSEYLEYNRYDVRTIQKKLRIESLLSLSLRNADDFILRLESLDIVHPQPSIENEQKIQIIERLIEGNNASMIISTLDFNLIHYIFEMM